MLLPFFIRFRWITTNVVKESPEISHHCLPKLQIMLLQIRLSRCLCKLMISLFENLLLKVSGIPISFLLHLINILFLLILNEFGFLLNMSKFFDLVAC